MAEYSLHIDDLRECPAGYHQARSSYEAIRLVKEMGCPNFISFDHDLGGEDTAMKFVDWMVEAALDGLIVIPRGFAFQVHSANPVGADNIRSKMDSFLRHYFQENGRNDNEVQDIQREEAVAPQEDD